MSARHETCETTQSWCVYTYGATTDRWWPLWRSTRVLGYAKIRMECCVCGRFEWARLRMPRFGPVPKPKSGRHVRREQFLADHTHPDRGHPMSWARPLRNMGVFGGAFSPDLLAMRLQADINERRNDDAFRDRLKERVEKDAHILRRLADDADD